MSREAVARVLGQAMVDQAFAEKLHADPAAAAHSLGVHLGTAEVAAMKDIQISQLDAVSKTIRGKLGIAAVLDQQQQQQARMD